MYDSAACKTIMRSVFSYCRDLDHGRGHGMRLGQIGVSNHKIAMIVIAKNVNVLGSDPGRSLLKS